MTIGDAGPYRVGVSTYALSDVDGAPGGELGVGVPLIELAEADLSDARRAPAHLAAEAAPENDMQDESEEAAARADGEGEQVPVGDGGVQQATNQGTRTSRARPLSLQGGPVRAP